eukprot:PRCOL_00002370-RA
MAAGGLRRRPQLRRRAAAARAALGLPPPERGGVSEEQVRAAYRRAALSAHPDKGGTAEGFARVRGAYEALLRTEAAREGFDEAAEAEAEAERARARARRDARRGRGRDGAEDGLVELISGFDVEFVVITVVALLVLTSLCIVGVLALSGQRGRAVATAFLGGASRAARAPVAAVREGALAPARERVAAASAALGGAGAQPWGAWLRAGHARQYTALRERAEAEAAAKAQAEALARLRASEVVQVLTDNGYERVARLADGRVVYQEYRPGSAQELLRGILRARRAAG